MRNPVYCWVAVIVVGVHFLLQAPLQAATFTTNASIPFYDDSYDGQALVVSNCTLTVDGVHSFSSVQVQSGGVITHSAIPNGSLSKVFSVTDEPHALSGTNPVPLLLTNVQSDSIQVTDLTGLQVYLVGADFSIYPDALSGMTILSRSGSSSIPDGATVLVDYQTEPLVLVGGTRLEMVVDGDVLIESGGAIQLDGCGYGSLNGPGQGGSAGSPQSGGGGGHGGAGGASSAGGAGGIAHDIVGTPGGKGGPGGNGFGGSGGAGGGALRLVVGGTLDLQGAISANGLNGTNSRAGGGAGGSLWITAGILSGSGPMTASGGSGEPIHGGGGGGGRIAIYFQTNSYSGNVMARGGAGFANGGAGTVYVRTNNLSVGSLTVENGGLAGQGTLITSAPEISVLDVSKGAVVVLSTSQLLGGLLVRSNGAVLAGEQKSLSLMVSGDVSLNAGGVISGYGAGYAPGTGTGLGGSYNVGLVAYGGGGGNGGVGGAGGNPLAYGGSQPQGTISSPTQLGGGGGGRTNGVYVGGAGGGALKITVNGSCMVDGIINFNGTSAKTDGGGGGAGGSLWLSVGKLAGSGLITANGGNGLTSGGGGGGGRIAVQYTSNTFSGTITAYGGAGANTGGAGTINLFNSSSQAALVVDNGGLPGAATIMSSFSGISGGVASDLSIKGGATLVWAYSQNLKSLLVASNSWLVMTSTSPSSISISSNVIIEPTGSVLADGISSLSTGFGSNGSGAGHGGYGGSGSNAFPGGIVYDSMVVPTSSGSIGGAQGGIGGYGGGVVVMTVNGPIRNDGIISANGVSGSPQQSIVPFIGGGSGGTVRLTATGLSGSGIIRANGGPGIGAGGGGGGGRISINCTSNLFGGQITAFGGPGYRNGGAGTVYLKVGQSAGMVLVNNGGLTGTNTPLQTLTGDRVQISGGGIVPLSSQTTANPNWGSLYVASNGWLTISGVVNLTVTGDVHVEPTGQITANGTGSGPNSGSGAGFSAGTGGGHGGYGGGSSNGVAGGMIYDFHISPTGLGSGGNPSSSSLSSGGAGGAAIHLTVGGTLLMDGALTADGTSGFSALYYIPAGGGSGGSIWVSAGRFAGSGLVSANGGNGANNGGGGGGGRIAISFNTNLFTGQITAYGGQGFVGGGAGTVYLRGNRENSAAQWIDNGGMSGTNTLVTLTSADDVIIQGGAVAVAATSVNFHHLTIKSNSWLIGWQYFQATASGNVTIENGGGVQADGLGSSGIANNAKVGGGHGGYGGGGVSPIGNAFDSIVSPFQSGNGGGATSALYGGRGGGAVKLAVAGDLRIDGLISVDGISGDPFFGGGGGAGGSVDLSANIIFGNGTIRARGGKGTGGGGGGGGGRISIHAVTNVFNGNVSAVGGSGAEAGGAGTVCWGLLPLKFSVFAPVKTPLLVRIDNGGLIGTNTPLAATFGLPAKPFDLSIDGSARLSPVTPLPLLSNLYVGSGALLVPSANPVVAVMNNLTIAAAGKVSAKGNGFPISAGPGAGSMLSYKGSGGGYGGNGGASSSGAPGGTNYGSAAEPVDPGSGGGYSFGPIAGGGAGGGAIRFSVGNGLSIAGQIIADGEDGIQDDAGGGAGGSIWINAKSISGVGAITANGGAGDPYGGGGGGGGRIAIYSPSNTFSGTIVALGGDGASSGLGGSVFATNLLSTFFVAGHSPSGITMNVVGAIDLTFNEVVDGNSVSVADFHFITPGGELPAGNLSITQVGLSTVRVSFPSQNAPGDYRIEAGPDMLDLFGQPMSQVYTGAFTLVLPTISGTISTTNGVPVPGVALLCSGDVTNSVITGADGKYQISFVPGASFSVTPALTNVMFVPGSRDYTVVTSSQTNQNHLAVTTIAADLSGAFSGGSPSLQWHGLPGVSYQVYSSTNLINWIPFGSPIPGTNALMEVQLPADVGPQSFFRMRASN